MFTLPLDTSKMGSFILETIEECVDYGTKEPKKNPETGYVQYAFNCRYLPKEEGAKPESVRIKVYCKSEPKVEPYTPIVFDVMTALYWTNNGKSGISFSAEKVGRRQ